ncbi:MAG: FMN-binding protein [Fretibacterium sp.]|nr:FMN-binding protein [Fretibacterium sp.]
MLQSLKKLAITTGLLLLLALFLQVLGGTAAASGTSDLKTPSEHERALADGIYTGSGVGYVDKIVVEVTISGGKISNIAILENTEDEGYFDDALGVLGNVIEAQSTKVNAISGATFSSKGILQAIEKALEKARTADEGGESSQDKAAAPAGKTEKTLDLLSLFSKTKILFALLVSCLMVQFLERPMKKHPWSFYCGAILIAVLSFCYHPLKWGSFLPSWVGVVFVAPLIRGSFAGALFILVMYAGALPARFRFVQKLLKLRAELSILACILTFGHNIRYGEVYFKAMLSGFQGLPAHHAAATLISLFLILIMLPLFLTSFPSVRRKMRASRWKQLQRWAYLFYAGLYLHILTLYAFDLPRRGLELALYTVIFGLYAFLRVNKALKNRAKKQQKQTT